MGDANSIMNDSDVRHLMRRAGFGTTSKDVLKILKRGLTRGQMVDALLKYKAKGLKASDDMDEVYDDWLQTMLKTKTPLLEKLTLFWHDHFSTNNTTVQDAKAMTRQNALLRSMGKGDFRAFLKAMNKDPAMMDFLDTLRNRRKTPNENYARELQELFTLGVLDETGAPNYAQEDIVQIARAFTGWRLDDKGNAVFRSGSHDYNADFPDRGPKVIFKNRGGYGPAGIDIAGSGEGAIEIDVVIDILLAHRDTQGQSTVGRRMTRRLFEFFAHASPPTALVDEILAQSGFAVSMNIAALVRAILVHDAFYASAASPTVASTKSVKWPVDYVVSTLRLLKVVPKKVKYQGLALEDNDALRSYLDNMGQRLFDPPSVFGWDWEAAWISSATLLARFDFARDLAANRARGKAGFHPEKLVPITLQSPTDILNAACDVLGLLDQLSASDRAFLITYLTDGGALPTLDLTDEDLRHRKLHGLFALLLQSPAYQLH
jgi:uncharacterized protein (DUF1800 family)